MTDLERLVGENMYETVQSLEDGRSIVRDVPTGTLYFKKILSVYNISVYSYLKDHPSPYVPKIHDMWKDGKNPWREAGRVSAF